jgi:hypothetical protein
MPPARLSDAHSRWAVRRIGRGIQLAPPVLDTGSNLQRDPLALGMPAWDASRSPDTILCESNRADEAVEGNESE